MAAHVEIVSGSNVLPWVTHGVGIPDFGRFSLRKAHALLRSNLPQCGADAPVVGLRVHTRRERKGQHVLYRITHGLNPHGSGFNARGAVPQGPLPRAEKPGQLLANRHGSRTHPADRRDFFLYVDEFQSFVSESFSSILSEARKYRLCLTLAHQYLAQLKPGIAEAVVGNVGSIVAFRVGHEDAEALEKAFGKAFAASAFTSLNNGEVYAKLLSGGRDIDPFLGRTLPASGVGHSKRATIIRRSREKHSKPRHLIEEKIRRWHAKYGT
ncbi:MAG TPA: type IV secretory system conjugative DNA transfer family protein [Opitutus sp.]|nr:type IV secretory system conjugative DNA transfer family protein [Opitutus sp.]